jgi:sugar-specific transcriptional regulator TrmB
MIVENAFIDKLREFGLNSYESKLWTALLSRGMSTAGELADISGVPRSRSYDVLETLADKGFIMIKPGKPIKYVAVAPEDVLDRVKSKIDDKTKDQLRKIDELKSDSFMGELKQLHSQGVEHIEVTDMAGCIKGRDNQLHHMLSMIKNAKKSVDIMTTSTGLLRKSLSLIGALKDAKRKGVKVRVAAPLTKDAEKSAKELSSVAEVKNCKDSGRFVIVDDKEAVFMLHHDKNVHKNYDAAVWINSPYFASTLSTVFNSAWGKL